VTPTINGDTPLSSKLSFVIKTRLLSTCSATYAETANKKNTGAYRILHQLDPRSFLTPETKTMLTSKDFIAVLVALVIFIVVIVQRHSGNLSRPVATPLPAILKSGTENDVNKDRRPGGE
jgi:hypothetical protein